MEKRAKIAWLYVIAALFVAVGLFLVVKKNTYLFFALPVVLGVLLLYIFSLDKVLLLTAFTVPLSVNLKALEAGLAISLPAEPLLMGIMILFFAKMLYVVDVAVCHCCLSLRIIIRRRERMRWRRVAMVPGCFDVMVAMSAKERPSW